MRNVFRDSGLQKEYVSTGHITASILSPAEISEILREMEKLQPNDKFSPISSTGEVTFHCSFLDTNKDYRRQVYDLISRVFTPHVERYLDDFWILNCNFYVKPTCCGIGIVHQNWPVLANLDDTTVTIWCPLMDADASNGTIEVVSGSHKLVPHVEGPHPNVPTYVKPFCKTVIDKFLMSIPIKAGDALIFDDSLIHSSGKNNSNLPRIAIQILCVPKGTQPVFHYYDDNSPEQFELIKVDSEFFLKSEYSDLLRRGSDWESLGFVPNRNRMLSEEEFTELMKNRGRNHQEIDPIRPVAID